MMDELDLLKKDWQKKDEQLPKLSYTEIYNMIWKKSSSVVKWIMIISVLELIVPNLLLLAFVGPEEFSFQDLGTVGNYYKAFNIFFYAVVVYFIFLFYKRYKEISVLDDSKSLMRKIIKTRKTVKHYVIFCLAMCIVFFAILIIGFYIDDSILLKFEGMAEKAKETSIEQIKFTVMWVFAIAGVVFTLFMGGIYFLLYGLLLRKLKANYKELEKLEL